MWDNKILEEAASLMSWEKFSLTKRRTSEFWVGFPPSSHPGHTLTGNKDVVGNSDLKRCPRGKKRFNW